MRASGRAGKIFCLNDRNAVRFAARRFAGYNADSTLIPQNIYNFYRRPVIHIGSCDTHPRIGGMDDPPVAHIDCHMVNITSTGIEYQISGSRFFRRNGMSLRCL